MQGNTNLLDYTFRILCCSLGSRLGQDRITNWTKWEPAPEVQTLRGPTGPGQWALVIWLTALFHRRHYTCYNRKSIGLTIKHWFIFRVLVLFMVPHCQTVTAYWNLFPTISKKWQNCSLLRRSFFEKSQEKNNFLYLSRRKMFFFNHLFITYLLRNDPGFERVASGFNFKLTGTGLILW